MMVLFRWLHSLLSISQNISLILSEEIIILILMNDSIASDASILNNKENQATASDRKEFYDLS